MKFKLSLLMILLFAIIISSCDNKVKTSIEPLEVTESEQAILDSASYMFGNQLGGIYSNFAGNLNFEAFIQGLEDAYNQKEDSLLMVPIQSEAPQRIFTAFNEMITEKLKSMNLEEAKAYLVENGKKDGVTTTSSGLQYEVIKEGTGSEVPTPSSQVKVHYHGTFLDGKVFDSSVDRGEPVVFPLDGVIPGWTEGVQLMTVGSKYRFSIPPELAYGEQGRFNQQAGAWNIEPNSLLIFEIELLEILPVEEPEAPEAPAEN